MLSVRWKDLKRRIPQCSRNYSAIIESRWVRWREKVEINKVWWRDEKMRRVGAGLWERMWKAGQRRVSKTRSVEAVAEAVKGD